MERMSGKSHELRESVMELFTEQKVDHENRPQIPQSTVIAPQHKIPAGYQYDGSNGLNSIGETYIPNYSPAEYIRSNGNTLNHVTNVTIHKYYGINWDDKLYTPNW